MKDAALAGPSGGLQPDPSAVTLDDPLGDGEAQAEPAERRPVRAPEPADTNVIDLMSALKKSLQKKGETTRAPAHKKTTSARRAKG